MNPEDVIIIFLKENCNERFSMLEISRRTNVGYNTVQKYIIILLNKNLIKMEDFGNVKVISYNEAFQ